MSLNVTGKYSGKIEYSDIEIRLGIIISTPALIHIPTTKTTIQMRRCLFKFNLFH